MKRGLSILYSQLSYMFHVGSLAHIDLFIINVNVYNNVVSIIVCSPVKLHLMFTYYSFE